MTTADLAQRYASREKPTVTTPTPFEELRWFFDCRVTSAGPGEDGVVWVQLTCPGQFEHTWFTALDEIGDRILLTALAALQSGLACTVAVAVTDIDGGQIYRLHPSVGEPLPSSAG